jgi:hypothetical protein
MAVLALDSNAQAVDNRARDLLPSGRNRGYEEKREENGEDEERQQKDERRREHSQKSRLSGYVSLWGLAEPACSLASMASGA